VIGVAVVLVLIVVVVVIVFVVCVYDIQFLCLLFQLFCPEFLRFKALEPTCYKVYDAEQTLKKARDTRDEGRKRLVAAETALASLRVEEVELSRRISDDHVVADSRGMHVSEVFPNVHLGNILVVINETPVEGLPFEDVLKVIDKFRSPHRVAFKRYDYRMDPITDKWLSLEELREMVGTYPPLSFQLCICSHCFHTYVNFILLCRKCSLRMPEASDMNLSNSVRKGYTTKLS
jgi:hypothetical protein